MVALTGRVFLSEQQKDKVEKYNQLSQVES